MSKSLLYRLFGLGKIPENERPALEAEGLVLVEEGIRGSITFRNFKAPWRRHSYRRSGFAGSIVLTEQRLVAYAFSKHVVNIPVNHPQFRKIEISVDKADRLCIAFEASDFHDDRSGSIELRFRTPQALHFAERIRSYRAS